MAITHRGITATTNGAASVTLAVPSGTTTGDFLVVVGWANVGLGLLGAPAGWKPIPRFERATGVNGNVATAFYYMQDSDDPQSYTFTATGAAASAWAMDVFIGVDVTFPLDVSPPSSVAGGAVTVAFPSITTITDSALHLCLLADDGTHPETAPAGYTTGLDMAAGTLATYYKVITPPGVASVSDSTGNSWVAGSIALQPLAGPPAAQTWTEIDDSTLPLQNYSTRQVEGTWV